VRPVGRRTSVTPSVKRKVRKFLADNACPRDDANSPDAMSVLHTPLEIATSSVNETKRLRGEAPLLAGSLSASKVRRVNQGLAVSERVVNSTTVERERAVRNGATRTEFIATTMAQDRKAGSHRQPGKGAPAFKRNLWKIRMWKMLSKKIRSMRKAVPVATPTADDPHNVICCSCGYGSAEMELAAHALVERFENITPASFPLEWVECKKVQCTAFFCFLCERNRLTSHIGTCPLGVPTVEPSQSGR
jgi:hypothetical protein